MNKIFIKNRYGLNVLVNVDKIESEQKGLAFIMPGLGSHHNKLRFRSMAKILNKYGYATVSFDPTNSVGESDGDYADATFTNYYEDLEDVIDWAKENLNSEVPSVRYMEPFILVGHSLGGMGVTLYTEKYPECVKALAPLSTTISGKLSIEARPKEEIENWRTLGYQEKVRRSNGQVNKLKWSHMEDRLKYDNLVEAQNIKVPVLMIVGENDPVTPPKHQQLLFDALGTAENKKELHIVKNADHEASSEESLPQVLDIFEKWLVKIS